MQYQLSAGSIIRSEKSSSKDSLFLTGRMPVNQRSLALSFLAALYTPENPL